MNQYNPTKIPSDWPLHGGHFLLHFLSGVIVFALGIGADMWLLDHRQPRPLDVRWAGGEFQPGVLLTNFPLTNFSGVEEGAADNGTLVWRPKP
jgi:hypothetical protein